MIEKDADKLIRILVFFSFFNLRCRYRAVLNLLSTVKIEIVHLRLVSGIRVPNLLKLNKE
jgi:hypothetical protein